MGVREVAAPGLSGVVSTFAPNALAIVVVAAFVGKDSDTLILPQLKQIASGASSEVVSFERRPVKTSTAGMIFPGDMPPNAKAVTKTVGIDTRVADVP